MFITKTKKEKNRLGYIYGSPTTEKTIKEVLMHTSDFHVKIIYIQYIVTNNVHFVTQPFDSSLYLKKENNSHSQSKKYEIGFKPLKDA